MGESRVPHFGHADAGMTIDLRSGIRTMQTFRKLPMIEAEEENEDADKRCGGHHLNLPHPPRPLK